MILEEREIEKIELITKMIRSVVAGQLYLTNVVISINGEGKDKYDVSLLSWDHSIRKSSSGDDLEKCLNDIISFLTIEVVKIHNKLQDQVRYLKEAIDHIT